MLYGYTTVESNSCTYPTKSPFVVFRNPLSISWRQLDEVLVGLGDGCLRVTQHDLRRVNSSGQHCSTER